jgi:hypothetical protein
VETHQAVFRWFRLRDEHSYTGGYTIVKDYVRLRKLSQREMFVPLEHPPGDAQADFGEAMVVTAGVERKASPRLCLRSQECIRMAVWSPCLKADNNLSGLEAAVGAHVKALAAS